MSRIISVSGFGYTGSGAVKDYLKEYSNIKVSKTEFPFLCAPDGLVNLARNVLNPIDRTGSAICAIERYIQFTRSYESSFCKAYSVCKREYRKSVDDFIERITVVSWKDLISSGSFFSRLVINGLLSERVIPHLERLLGKQVNCYPMKKVRISGPANDFFSAARVHLRELLGLMGISESGYVVLDQAFSANNPQECFPFFDDSKVIIVDRDPRDLYVFSHEMLAGYGHFMPMSKVEDFIKYYRCIRAKQQYLKPDYEHILVLHFEDLVYHYDVETKRINDFLGLDESSNRFQYFNPQVSIGNTMLYRRFKKYDRDISIIEKELSEYLYKYEMTDCGTVSQKMFV